MTAQKKVKTKQKLLDLINYFKKLTFYKTYIEKPKIDRLKNKFFTIKKVFLQKNFKSPSLAIFLTGLFVLTINLVIQL